MKKLIPYDLANFRNIIEKYYYNVDKIHNIPLLDQEKLQYSSVSAALETPCLRKYSCGIMI